MADDTVKRLLIKLGISTTEFQAAVKEIKSQLDQLYQAEKVKAAARRVSAQQDATEQQKQLDIAKQAGVVAQQTVSQIQKQIQLKTTNARQLRDELAQEKTRLDVKASQLKLLAAEGQVTGEVLKKLQDQLTTERAMLSLRQAQARAATLGGPEGAEGIGGFIGGGLKSLASGLFGGGLVGTIAVGAAAGAAFEHVLEGIGEKLRELVQESGKLIHIEDTFKALAGKSGLDAVALLEDMSKATHGLVNETNLMSFAIKLFQQNIPLTSEQISGLVGKVTDLARSMGQDATQAMDSLTNAMASGRFRGLALQLALDKTTQSLLTQAERLPTNVRALTELLVVYDAVQKKLEASGPPVVTFSEQIQRLGEVVGTVFEKLSVSLTKGSGFGDLGSKITELADFIENNTTTAVGVLAGAFDVLAQMASVAIDTIVNGVQTAGTALTVLSNIVVDLIGGFGALSSNSSVFAGFMNEIADRASSLTGIIVSTLEVLELLISGFDLLQTEILGDIKLAFMYFEGLDRAMTGLVHGGLAGMKAAWKQAMDEMAKASKELSDVEEKQNQKLLDFILRMEMIRKGTTPKETGVTGPPQFTNEEDVSLMKQLEQKKVELQKLSIEGQTQQVKAGLDAQLELYKEYYAQGELSLKDFVQKSIQIKQQEAEADKTRIELELKAKLGEIGAVNKALDIARKQAEDTKAEITTKLASTTDPTKKEGLQSNQTLIDRQLKMLNADNKQQAMDAAIARKNAANEIAKIEIDTQKYVMEQTAILLGDELEARKTIQQEITKITKSAVEERMKLLENEFKRGDISGDDYLARRRALIEQERNLVRASLEEQLQDSEKSEKQKTAIRVQMIEAEVQAEKDLTQLSLHENEIRLEGVENQYKRLHDFVDAQQKIAQGGVQRGEPGAEVRSVQIQEELHDLNEAQLKQLTEMLGTVREGSQEWFEIAKQIGNVNAEQAQLNAKLAQARDIAGPLAGLFGQMAKVFGSSAAGNWFSRMSQTMKDLSEFNRQMALVGGAKSGLSSLGGSFTSLFKKGPAAKGPESELDQFKSQVSKAGDGAGKFAASMDEVVAKLKGMAGDAKVSADALSKQLEAQVEAASQKVVSGLNPLSEKIVTAAQAVQTFTDALLNSTGRVKRVPREEETVEVTATPLEEEEAPTGQEGVVGVVPGSNLGQMGQGSINSVISSFGDMLGGVTQKGKALTDKWAEWNTKFNAFIGKLGAWVQGVGAVANAILGSKSTVGGIASGGMAGLKFGAQFGPWGAAIGAAVGATLGGIVGHKSAEMQKTMADIKTKLQGIQDNINNGTVSLGQAIQQLQGLRSAASAALGSSKKGRKQLPAVLQGINDQINALMAQQKKTLDDLHAQLAILLEPTQYQGILDSLSQIIQKYQQFASAAAGNAAEMTNANQWLVASLKAYAQTMADEVRSANEQAIQDKEKLIDLQDQMNQLTQQEYDILTQGVLVRQRPTAMVKGAQIEQIEEQKQQLKVETDLQQTKVDAEQKMFNLANDRLGLEQQMAALQKQDIDEQMAKIAAMQASLLKLNAALGAGGTLPGGLFNATGGIDIQALEQLLGLPITSVGPKGAGQPFIQNVPPIYQEFIDTISKSPGHANFDENLLAAAATPFGSPQRAAIDEVLRSSDIGSILVNAGLVQKPVHGVSQDPNWLNFFGWIMNIMKATTPGTTEGTVPTPVLPGLDTGGYVEETGTAIVHKGEVVLNQGQVNAVAAKHPLQTGVGDKVASQWQLQTHQTIMTMAQNRIGMEMKLLMAQREQTKLEISRMEMLSDLLKQTSIPAAGGSLIENQLSSLYGVRGRYGSASFRRELL